MGQRAYLTCDPCHALVKSRHQARQHFDRGIDRHAVRHGLWTSDSGRGTGFGTVGLLYGPSGCGKSSLVKAGLSPNLSSEVIAIYVEATPEETEQRILRQLHKRIPELPTELRLAETAERVRRSEGPKVVLIVNQFEQWLYSHRVDQQGDLVPTPRWGEYRVTAVRPRNLAPLKEVREKK